MARERNPRESLRHKLAILGIPRETHQARTLAGMLPVCLDGAPLDQLDPDALAEALIYLIDKGIIRVPCRVEGLLDFGWGTHVCQFYRDQDELLEFLTAYFRQGLEGGEYCVWVAPDPAASDALQNRLARATPHFQRYESGMEYLAHEAWYLDASGALKPAEIILGNWVRKAGEALAAGYRGLRCAAQLHVIDRTRWNEIAEYECEVNAAVSGLNIKAVCAYPLLECGVRQLTDARNSHQDLLVKGDRWWHSITAADATEANAVLMALQGGRP